MRAGTHSTCVHVLSICVVEVFFLPKPIEIIQQNYLFLTLHAKILNCSKKYRIQVGKLWETKVTFLSLYKHKSKIAKKRKAIILGLLFPWLSFSTWVWLKYLFYIGFLFTDFYMGADAYS